MTMANICPCTFGNSISHALNNLRNAKKLSEKGPEQSAAATVLSRKVDTCYNLEKSDSSWAYLVTFRLEDQSEISLRTSEADYSKLKEGKSVIITWQNEQLLSFVMELG